MPEPATSQSDRVQRLLRGGSRPVLAIVAFLAAFLFAALPFVIDTDNYFIVGLCFIACFTCSFLFMRLLIGELGPVKWFFLGGAAYLCVCAGREWYVVVLLTGGTLACTFLLDRLMGRFDPLIRVSNQHRV